MPGFPFGPTRPNTRAGLPTTSRVLVPAVRRSVALPVSGAAAARGRKGIAPAIATPDARICRRGRKLGVSFLLQGPFHVCVPLGQDPLCNCLLFSVLSV